MKLRSLLATGLIALTMCSTVFAAERYDGNKIIAGEGIPEGYYCLYNTSETRSASYSIKNGSYKLVNDTFNYNAIVYLDSDDVLYMENCYAVPLDDARINPINEFMGEVGTHIRPGEYQLVFLRDSSQSGLCTIYNSIDFHNYYDDDEDNDAEEDNIEKEVKVSNGSDTTIELEEGQYVKLDGCYLTDVDDDD